MPSETLFLTFLRTRDAPLLEAFAMVYSLVISSGTRLHDAASCGYAPWCRYVGPPRASHAYGAFPDKTPTRSGACTNAAPPAADSLCRISSPSVRGWPTRPQ